jgi:hypothetical protein
MSEKAIEALGGALTVNLTCDPITDSSSAAFTAMRMQDPPPKAFELDTDFESAGMIV